MNNIPVYKKTPNYYISFQNDAKIISVENQVFYENTVQK